MVEDFRAVPCGQSEPLMSLEPSSHVQSSPYLNPATAASRLVVLAGLDGKATLDDKVDFSNLRTRLKALMRESEEVHAKLNAHRDEHGC